MHVEHFAIGEIQMQSLDKTQTINKWISDIENGKFNITERDKIKKIIMAECMKQEF